MMIARTIADLEGFFKQLISLNFLIASAHWACADVLDHHTRGAHQPHRNLDRPSYMGSNLYFTTLLMQDHVRNCNLLMTNVLAKSPNC